MYHKRCMRIFFYRQLFVLPCTIRFAEALVMDYLALSEEADRVADVRVVGETEDIVVGCAGFLLCGEVFVKVGYDVALRLEIGRGERSSRGGDRVDAGRMVNEVITEAAGFYLVDGESLCELIKYSRYHLNVRELLCTYIVFTAAQNAERIRRLCRLSST